MIISGIPWTGILLSDLETTDQTRQPQGPHLSNGARAGEHQVQPTLSHIPQMTFGCSYLSHTHKHIEVHCASGDKGGRGQRAGTDVPESHTWCLYRLPDKATISHGDAISWTDRKVTNMAGRSSLATPSNTNQKLVIVQKSDGVLLNLDCRDRASE